MVLKFNFLDFIFIGIHFKYFIIFYKKIVSKFLFLNIITLTKMSTVFRTRSSSTQMKYRKWQKIIQPLIKYNRNQSQISYPMDFINKLQQLVSKGYELKLNIPTTLSGAQDNCLKTVFKNTSQQIGKVNFTPNVLKANFDTQIQKQINEKIQELCSRESQFKSFIQQKQENNNIDQTLPFVFIKQKTKIGQFQKPQKKTFLLSKDEYKKIINIDSNQILQTYIFNNSSKSSITRFFYYPKKQTLSIAYKIDNNQNFMKKKFYKSLWRIKNDNQHSFTFVKILHHNKSFTKQTMNLVKLIQNVQKVVVQRIVCDWIIDPYNRYYLFDVKQIKYQPFQPISIFNKNLTEVLALITCCVCQQKFQNAQINKLITHKLIWQFFEHLKKRKVQLTFKPNYKYSSNTARVCDLCYMLVVSQSKLIQLQKVLAKATNSVQKVQNQYTKMLQDLNKNQIQQYKQKNLRQLYSWRLFFYIQDIKQIDSLQQTFNPQQQYYLMINLHNQITSFKLSQISDNENLSVKGLKITYLFSEKQKIQKFLNKSEIVIRITYENNWNSVLAQGISNSLYEQSQKFSMRKFKQILLFNQKSKYCVMGLHIGIKLDGRYSTEKLTLSKVYDAYLPNQKYINCLSIPPEWMQIIDPIYCINKEMNKKFQYEMNMTTKQIKSLLPIINNTNKKKLVL